MRYFGESHHRHRIRSGEIAPLSPSARLPPLPDRGGALAANSANLGRVVTQGLDSRIGLTRCDNYLLDAEDGELS